VQRGQFAPQSKAVKTDIEPRTPLGAPHSYNERLVTLQSLRDQLVAFTGTCMTSAEIAEAIFGAEVLKLEALPKTVSYHEFTESLLGGNGAFM